MTAPVLEISGLSVCYRDFHALKDVSLSLFPGDRLGLVGESGSGKSTLGLAILGLLPPVAETTGTIRFRGAAMPYTDDRAMSAIRGRHVGFVFQDPMGGFSPIHTIGRHLNDAIVSANPGIGRQAALDRALNLLEEMEIRDPAARLSQYPHQLSGGMLQRVMIATALAGNPDILIADEPTTALDATTQAAILKLLDRITQNRNMATILITHDLGVVSHFCCDLAVMYFGRVVSLSSVARALSEPSHPYTAALLRARPRLDEKPARLRTIGGGLPSQSEQSQGCTFEPRCEIGHGKPLCKREEPQIRPLLYGDRVACHSPLGQEG